MLLLWDVDLGGERLEEEGPRHRGRHKEELEHLRTGHLVRAGTSGQGRGSERTASFMPKQARGPMTNGRLGPAFGGDGDMRQTLSIAGADQER